ncbi:hypothetical protein M0804_001123 [Polistes exclamans]|nr:hypothetical protein M0804_001123 [Polistes exclamans]
MKDEHPMEDLISRPTSATPMFLPTTTTTHVVASPIVEGLQLVAYANVYRLIFVFIRTKVMTNDGCIEAQWPVTEPARD